MPLVCTKHDWTPAYILIALDVNFVSFSLRPTYLRCLHVFVNVSRSALPAQVLWSLVDTCSTRYARNRRIWHSKFQNFSGGNTPGPPGREGAHTHSLWPCPCASVLGTQASKSVPLNPKLPLHPCSCQSNDVELTTQIATGICHLAFSTLPLLILSVTFLKLTASSRPLAPYSGSPKCLRFGHWLTLCTINIHIYTYLLTYLLTTVKE